MRCDGVVMYERERCIVRSRVLRPAEKIVCLCSTIIMYHVDVVRSRVFDPAVNKKVQHQRQCDVMTNIYFTTYIMWWCRMYIYIIYIYTMLLEKRGIDPLASRMRSERSTI